MHSAKRNVFYLRQTLSSNRSEKVTDQVWSLRDSVERYFLDQ